MKAVVLIGAFLLTPVLHAAAPGDFAGWYKLVSAKAGSCEQDFEGSYVERSQEGGDLRLSSFHFNDVNLGQQVFDDQLMKIVSLASTDARGAHSKTRMLTKATGEVSVTVNHATLAGDTLTLWSRTHLKSPTEPGFSFTTHCVYRRTAPPDDPLQP